MIHITDGQTDLLLDVIVDENIIEDTHKKSLQDTMETYDFTTFANKRFAEHLAKRNRIIIPDEDDTLTEFIIEEVGKYHEDEGMQAEVYTTASYLQLQKENIIHPQTLDGQTPATALGYALDGTEWTPGITEGKGSRTFRIDEYTNPYAFLKRIANEFDLELRFRVEHNGVRITGRYVDLLERVGAWRGREIVFGRDLDGIRRIEKTDNIVTALLGVGPEQEDGTRLEVLVEDNDALQRWGRNGKHLIDVYEPQSDREDMTEEELIQYTRTELDKRINEVVEYEATVADLENVPKFGDTLKIKDMKFNPPLYLEARVYEQERSVVDKSKKTIRLGDYTEYTEDEVKGMWEDLLERIREKISARELLEYTYDKLTIDEKDEAVFEEGKSFAELIGQDAKEYADATARTVADDAERRAKDYAEEQAEWSYEQARMYAVSKEVYDNKMEEIAASIAERASIEYVDGQLVSKADKADTYRIEEVDNLLLNKVSVTEYETDMDGIVTELEDHRTMIAQNEEMIGLKADKTQLDAIEGTVKENTAQLNIHADQIESKVGAEYVQDAIAGVGRWVKEYNVNTDNPQPLTEMDGSLLSDNYTYEVIAKVKGTATDTTAIAVFKSNKEGTSGGDWGWTLEKIYEKGTNSNHPEFFLDDEGRPAIRLYSHEKFYTVEVTHEKVRSRENVSSISHTRLNTAETRINQKADRVEITALETELDAVEGRVTEAEGEITTIAGEVQLKASQTVVDAIAGRVDQAESSINVLSDEIELKVDADGVISAINLSKESAKIQAENIELIGAVTVLSDITGDLGNITAGNISGVLIEGATIEQRGDEGSLILDEEGFKMFDKEDTLRIAMLTKEVGGIHGDTLEFRLYAQEFENAPSDEPVLSIGHYYVDSYIEAAGYLNLISKDLGVNIRSRDGLSIETENPIDGAAVFVHGGQLSVTKGAHSGGIGFGSGEIAHVITKHNTGDYMVVYPQRFAGQDIFRIRSHNQKSDYENDLRLTEKSDLLVNNRVKTGYGVILSNQSNTVSASNDRYQMQYNPSNGSFELISKDSSGDWWYRIETEGRSPGTTHLYDRIRSDGTMSATTTNSPNIHIFTSSSRMARTTSSRRYKILEEPVKVDYYKILEVMPKDWFDKNEIDEYAEELTKRYKGEEYDLEDIDMNKIRRIPGLVAEDVHDAGLGQYIHYNEEGEPESIMYERLWTLLLPIVRDHQEQIQDLKVSTQDQQSKIKELEVKVNGQGKS